MSPISIAVLAVGMSIDAFIASVGRGASLGRPHFGQAIRTGFVFGLVETITPLFATAIGTSIDAMAVGVSLAFLDVNILIIALAIGASTFVMATGGMLAGRVIGVRFGRWAEVIGGVALFGVGLSILISHLTAS